LGGKRLSDNLGGDYSLQPVRKITNEDFLLRSISDGTSSATGTAFFRALVKNLSQALATYGAWITEYLPEVNRLRSYAFWLGEAFVDHYEYDIRGTPCEKLLREKKYLHIPDNVVNLFPGDPDLPKLGAVSYLGFPLLNPQNEILGNIAVLDTQPMPHSFRNLAIFRIFGARATAEILRLKAEAVLLDREAKLRGIFDGAMDAIVEFDQEFRITMINPAASRLISRQQGDITGTSLKLILTGDDFHRLTDYVTNFDERHSRERKIWIPGGLTIVGAQDKEVYTEATLSQLEILGARRYVLIFRDAEQLNEAEKLIASLKDETCYLRNEIKNLYNHGRIIGKSQSFRRTLELVAEVAPTDSTILLFGETGTGKELIARAIHDASQRRDQPMITVNCAAIPASLMESEFFGHEKGAFTGATQRREGRFSLADGGTIFLDEVGELDLELQAKLLRVLQEGEVSPVGSSHTRRVDVRIIAATNRNLSQAVQRGEFRTDLYYRLSVFPINLPPLRERHGDIELLAAHFAEKYAARMGRQVQPLSPEIKACLRNYSWPGNVRELQNVIERGIITARHGQMNLDYALPEAALPEAAGHPSDSSEISAEVLTVSQMRLLEKRNLTLALQKSKWKVAGKNGAAHLLGIPASTLQSRMKTLGIDRTRPV